ncbi:unnamed protein product [Urochloa decumbens]|uniref:SAP domain-containing protein n=1 Tax=Urochloa decumbens TaxID=240449 RepID=A0ABC8WK88_9POAL
MDFTGMKRRELQALCKRHGLPAGGTNAALVARLDAALSGGAGAEEEEDVAGVAARKGCLKRSAGDAGEAKKVTFAVEESRGRRRKSRVVWSPVVAKTRGKRADAGSADSAADEGISAKADSNVPVRRSRRNSLTAAEAEEVKEAVTVDSKRKRKSQEIAEDVAVSAQVVASCRVTRRSSLSETTALLPPAAEKKRGRGKAADGKNKLVAEAQGLSMAAPPTVVESKRSRRKEENCEPDMQNSAKVEVSARTTRSRSVEAVVMSPTVVHNKRRRKAGDAQPDVELPRNGAPVTRSLRSRVVQVNNSVVDETHTSQQLENKMQPSRPATRRHQQVTSSLEEENKEQVAAPSKAPPLRRSGRNNSDATNANSESNRLSSAPVEAKDSKIDHPLTRHNAKAEDVEKQLIVNESVRRSKRKSVVSAMLDNEEKDLIEEKNPEAHVRRSKRKSVVPVKDIKGVGEEIQNAKGEEIQNAKGEDATRQPAVKQPVRRSTRKSLVSSMHGNEEKDLIAENNPGATVRRSMRKSIVPVNDIKGVDEDAQNAKGKDVEKQLVAKQPVRRSSRRSVLPDTVDTESGFLVAETNAEAHVRESTRTSVLPNSKESPDHSKMARNENLKIGKCEDEKQQKAKEPVRRSRRSVATVTAEGKISTIPTRRLTRKSIALNVVEKGSMDHVEKVGREQSGTGRKKSKVIDQCTDRAVTVVTSGNELQVEVAVQKNQGLQWSTGKSSDHNLADDNERHPGSDKCVSCERAGEEDLKLRKHRRSSIEISSSANDSSNKEDFSGQKFRKQQSSQTPSGKDNTGANYDKPLGTQQASNSTTSKGRSSKRRQTTVSEVMSAEEANDDMVTREATKDTHTVSHDYSKEISSRVQEICQVNATREEFSSGPLLGTVTLPDEICSAQGLQRVIPGSESGDAAEESLDKSKQPHERSDIQADDSHLSETRNGDVDQSSSIAEVLPHNGSVSENKTLIGEASGSALPISDSNPEIHCDTIVEQSIQAADLGRCPSKGGKGNPLLTNLHSESAADDSICPSLNAAKGCSSDGRRSSFGLEFLFTEECKESCSRNVENTAVEVDGGHKSTTSVTPGFYVGSDCGLEDEDQQCTGCDADKTLGVHLDITEEEVAEEKSYVEQLGAKTDLKTKLNGELTGLDMESDCSIAEKNVRLVADNPDAEEATIEVQQADVQEGDPEKPSQSSATPECKHECGLPEETILHSKKNNGCLSIAEQSPFGLQSLFLHESIEKSVEYSALASATVYTENGSDELKDSHVKCALEITHVSEPFSHHDTDEGSCSVSKNDVFMRTFQQDNGIEGLSKASLEEECVSSVFSVDAKHIKEVTYSEEISCKGEGSKKLVQSGNLKSSSEKQDVNGPADNAYGVSNAVLNALHSPANDSYDACLVSNTELPNQGHNDRCSEDTEERFASKPWTNDIIENATAKYSESGVVLLPAEERSHLQDGQLNSKLEGAKVVESCLNFSKDISSILDDGSVVGSPSERTLCGSGLPKDLSIEYSTRQELLDGSSVETFLDGSTTCEERDVSRVDTIDNSSFTLATPGYKHEDALSEEAVRTMKKYAGTCSLNPRGLLMDLQSLFSKENIEESDPHHGIAFPSAESPGDESINVKQRVEVHLGSNMSQLESTDLLDELIGRSKTEVPHQGHKDGINEDREEQVASGPCTNDIVEAAAAKHIEIGAVLLPSEERSNLKDGQVNPKQESSMVMESGFNCNKVVTSTSDNGSGVDIVGQRTPSGSGLPEDYRMDDNLQNESLDGCSVEPSLQGSTMFGKKIVSGVAGIIGNPSFSLATPDYKHEGALPEEAVCKMKQYTGRCSADPRHLLLELQSLFLEGSIEKSDSRDDLAFPSAESGRNEPTVWHVEQPVDALVSLEPNTYQGLRQDLSRAEAKESCMSLSVQHNESGGFLRSSHMKDQVTSTEIDLSDDAHIIERNIVVEEGLCEEKEKRKSMSTSDSDILYEKSHSDEYGICQSHSHGQKQMVENNPNLSSCDSEMLHRDHKEEISEPNEDKIIPEVPENGMSEAAPVEGTESAIMLPLVAGTLEMPDEQLKTKLSDEGEEDSFSCDKDTIETSCAGSAKKDLFPLPKDCPIDSCQKQEVPDVLSLLKSLEESANYLDGSVSGSGPCGQRCTNESSSMQVTSNTEAFHQDHEENYENNEGQITPGITASSVSEAVQIEKPEWEMGLPPPARTSALSDEQINMEVEGHKVDEHSCCYDKDTESRNSKASSLHKDTHKDLPSDLSALRSPKESTVLQNYYAPGSVGICQSSRQRGIDELRAKLQSFKVSSTVKGSYIAMSAPRAKPGNNLSQSAIASLQNRENPPAVKTEQPAKLNPDRSVTKDSSRRALQPISGRPGDH